jgi:hypothetical protein
MAGSLTGTLSTELGIVRALTPLDWSYNELKGALPNAGYLLFNGNKLAGTIPNERESLTATIHC